MQQIINEYIDHGLALCPIPPGTKGPTTKGWNLKENALKSQNDLPAGYGVGLMHAYSGTMALDIDEMGKATTLLKDAGIDLEALLNAPDAVKVISGMPGRGKLIYRLPSFIGPMVTKQISDRVEMIYELRCASQEGLSAQDCIYPTVHKETGKPYTWEGDWKNPPIIPGELLEHWQKLTEQDNQRTIPTGEFKGSVNASWAEIEAALEYIPANLNYPVWSQIGMALHWVGVQTGEEGRALSIWDQWSRTAPDRYCGERKMLRYWKSFSTDKKLNLKKLGTIFYIAGEFGWKRPQIDASELFRIKSNRTGLLVELDESGDITPLPTIIQDYIEANATVMVWGEPGSYKSFIVTDWMLSVASGLPWCGKKTVQGSAWYLAGEGHGGIRQRVAAWRMSKRYDGPLDIMYSTKAISLDSDSGDKSEGLKELLNLVNTGEVPSMIVVDTLARSMVGDENSTRDASRFVAATDELIAAIRSTGSDCCIVLVHHSRKDGGTYRGSSAFRGAIDIEFEVSRFNNQGALVTAHKRKDGELPQPIQLKGKVVSLGLATDNHGDQRDITSLTFEQASLENQKRSFVEEVTMQAEHIVRILKRDYPNNAATRNQLIESLRKEGIKFRTVEFSAWMDVLEDKGFIHISKSKSGWVISPADLNPVSGSRVPESLPPFLAETTRWGA